MAKQATSIQPSMHRHIQSHLPPPPFHPVAHSDAPQYCQAPRNTTHTHSNASRRCSSLPPEIFCYQTPRNAAALPSTTLMACHSPEDPSSRICLTNSDGVRSPKQPPSKVTVRHFTISASALLPVLHAVCHSTTSPSTLSLSPQHPFHPSWLLPALVLSIPK